MDLILGIFIGVLLGGSIVLLAMKGTASGTLHLIIDKDDGSTYMFLTDVDIKNVRSKKFATFEITQK